MMTFPNSIHRLKKAAQYRVSRDFTDFDNNPFRKAND